jgi:hypothetical protein
VRPTLIPAPHFRLLCPSPASWLQA